MTDRLADRVTQRYARAGRLARLAMGRTTPVERRRHDAADWRADDDPLAWWLLTEILVDYGRPLKTSVRTPS